ncbi:hypothetical protein P3T76_015277 [Phytophthora citrophthora]|uniref:Uncharacterized protein n=1 Tax=Phytophthora citrophthora TaxID=4793 RepID=A0AAD9G000_9STRA|nr:hypothetical protein P3T76_015277 [Phytophthora citrophthora]
MGEKSQVTLLKKGLPWLKRLQGALDDDDSSDSCSLSTDVTPKKATPVKKEEPKSKRIKKRRPLQLKSESSDDASSDGSGGKKEKKRRLVKKPVKVRHKQTKDVGPRVDSATTTGSAVKGKRVGKLASRVAIDINEKTPAIKQKRQQPAKPQKATKSRLKESRAAQKASTAVDADVEDEGEPRRQRKMRPVAAKEGMKRKRKVAPSTKADSKTDPADSSTRVIDKDPDSKPDAVVPPVVTKDVAAEIENHEDKTTPARPEGKDAAKVTKRKDSATTSTKEDSKTDPVSSPTRTIDNRPDSRSDEKCDVVPAAVTMDVADDLKKNEGDKMKVISPARAEDEEESSVVNGNAPSETTKAECDTKPPVVTKETSDATSEKITEEGTGQGKPEDPKVLNGMSTIGNAEPPKVELVKTEEGQTNIQKTESLRETELLDTPRKSPCGGESAAPPSCSKIIQDEGGQAKLPTPKIDENTTEELLENIPIPRKTKEEEDALDNVPIPRKTREEEKALDSMPIPRKTKERGVSSPLPSASSFVIPKRTFAKTDGGFKATGQVGRAVSRSSPFKRSLDPPVTIRVPPQPSPQSSPAAEFIPPQRKRTKNPVPVKNAPLSPQDRALMRLSRKRNSIFVAAAELAADSTDTMGSKKGPTTRMMGYEVYDEEGKMLSDLIPRLTCATKHEMASDRESFAASFFGVSCLAPKAKGDSVVNERGATEAGARKINCYEELRFERPEDRELYQRKMYGTTFVPQNVRGRTTLIVRNARFERKSTGIRFNQDRDREEFAAAMSKRYTFKKSVPRCDIPRENWQRLMRNQPGTVYLHYYNREDAERASQVFRDDDGQLLQIRLELKAGAKIKTGYSSSSGSRPEHTPRRSCSSERSALEPSPLSSQHGSARNTPTWRRDRSSASHSDRNSRYDRGAPPPLARWQRGEDRYGPTVSGNKRLRERRSRSRSRPESFQRQRNDSYGRAGSETGGVTKPSGADMIDGSNVNDVNDDATGSPAPKRARTAPLSPRRSPTSDQDRRGGEKKVEDDLGAHEAGEIKKSAEVALSSPVGNSDGDGRWEQQRGRSPPRRWQQQPHNASPRSRRGSFSDNPHNRPAGSAQYRSSQQPPFHHSLAQRPRSRSGQRASSPGRHGRGGNYGDEHQERRGSRDYGRGPYDNNGRMHDRGRGGYNNRSGGASSRTHQ